MSKAYMALLGWHVTSVLHQRAKSQQVESKEPKTFQQSLGTTA
jgi:hypothetical protein